MSLIYSVIEKHRKDFASFILAHIHPTPSIYLSIVEKNFKGDFNDVNPIDLDGGVSVTSAGIIP